MFAHGRTCQASNGLLSLLREGAGLVRDTSIALHQLTGLGADLLIHSCFHPATTIHKQAKQYHPSRSGFRLARHGTARRRTTKLQLYFLTWLLSTRSFHNLYDKACDDTKPNVRTGDKAPSTPHLAPASSPPNASACQVPPVQSTPMWRMNLNRPISSYFISSHLISTLL